MTATIKFSVVTVRGINSPLFPLNYFQKTEPGSHRYVRHQIDGVHECESTKLLMIGLGLWSVVTHHQNKEGLHCIGIGISSLIIENRPLEQYTICHQTRNFQL